MSSKTVSLLVRSLFAVGFVMIGALQSCGGGSSDAVALCQQGCDKMLMCTPDGGAFAASADTACKNNCPASTSTTTKCTNLSAIESAVKTCLAMDCSTYLNCLETSLPACQGGGTTGTGGTTGAGNSGGTGAGNSGGTGAGSGGSGAGTGGTTGTGGGSNGSGGTSGATSCSTCTKAQPCCVGALQLFGADAGACSFSATTCNALTGASQTEYIMACSEELTAGADLGVAACN